MCPVGFGGPASLSLGGVLPPIVRDSGFLNGFDDHVFRDWHGSKSAGGDCAAVTVPLTLTGY